mmetsp:Transcript_140658/g.350665  ORF Transcript_140658/g.350665 Transcript_140658/m.350665 type:complete len:259 (+) Transcript_140658:521-1297(+)
MVSKNLCSLDRSRPKRCTRPWRSNRKAPRAASGLLPVTSANRRVSTCQLPQASSSSPATTGRRSTESMPRGPGGSFAPGLSGTTTWQAPALGSLRPSAACTAQGAASPGSEAPGLLRHSKHRATSSEGPRCFLGSLAVAAIAVVGGQAPADSFVLWRSTTSGVDALLEMAVAACDAKTNKNDKSSAENPAAELSGSGVDTVLVLLTSCTTPKIPPLLVFSGTHKMSRVLKPVFASTDLLKRESLYASATATGSPVRAT